MAIISESFLAHGTFKRLFTRVSSVMNLQTKDTCEFLCTYRTGMPIWSFLYIFLILLPLDAIPSRIPFC